MTLRLSEETLPSSKNELKDVKSLPKKLKLSLKNTTSKKTQNGPKNTKKKFDFRKFHLLENLAIKSLKSSNLLALTQIWAIFKKKRNKPAIRISISLHSQLLSQNYQKVMKNLLKLIKGSLLTTVWMKLIKVMLMTLNMRRVMMFHSDPHHQPEKSSPRVQLLKCQLTQVSSVYLKILKCHQCPSRSL